MENKLLLHKLEILQTKRAKIHMEEQDLIDIYLDRNQDKPFEETLKVIGGVSKIQAIKMVYDLMGGTLKTSKAYVDKLLK